MNVLVVLLILFSLYGWVYMFGRVLTTYALCFQLLLGPLQTQAQEYVLVEAPETDILPLDALKESMADHGPKVQRSIERIIQNHIEVQETLLTRTPPRPTRNRNIQDNLWNLSIPGMREAEDPPPSYPSENLWDWAVEEYGVTQETLTPLPATPLPIEFERIIPEALAPSVSSEYYRLALYFRGQVAYYLETDISDDDKTPLLEDYVEYIFSPTIRYRALRRFYQLGEDAPPGFDRAILPPAVYDIWQKMRESFGQRIKDILSQGAQKGDAYMATLEGEALLFLEEVENILRNSTPDIEEKIREYHHYLDHIFHPMEDLFAFAGKEDRGEEFLPSSLRGEGIVSMAQVLQEGVRALAQGKREQFSRDYQIVREAYPHDPAMRLELALYRKALERMMETEFFLSLIATGRPQARHTFSSIVPAKGMRHDFYQGLRQYHGGLEQRFHEQAGIIKMLTMTTLLTQAQLLVASEAQMGMLEKAFSLSKSLGDEDIQKPWTLDNDLISTLINLSVDAAEEEGNANLVIDTRRKLQEGLLHLVQAQIERNDALFRDQPWGMILLTKIEWEGTEMPLRDVVIELHDNGTPEEEIWHLLAQSAQQILDGMSHTIHFYRTQREALLAHHLLSEEVIRLLEEEGDREALDIYKEFREEHRQMMTPSDLLVTLGGFGLCTLSSILKFPLALVNSFFGVFDRLSTLRSMLRGGILGLNSLSQYEMMVPLSTPGKIIPEFAIVAFVAIACKKVKPKTPLSLLRRGLVFSSMGGSHWRMIFSRERMRRMAANMMEKVKDVNALPAALASILTLVAIQFSKGGIESLSDPEFILTASIFIIVELVLTFNALSSGKRFFSVQHRNAMRDTSLIVFGTAAVVQFIHSQMQDELPFNTDRAFFEAIYDPLIGLTTTKLTLNYLANPFVRVLQIVFPMMNEKLLNNLGRLVLMLTKNGGGNLIFLETIEATFNEDDFADIYDEIADQDQLE